MKLKSQMQKGFTLIELMITVAIVGILAAVALPAYQDYTIRGQASEGMVLAEGAKTAVAETYANKGAMPTTNAEAGFDGATGKYVSTVEIGANGVITATYGGDANATNLKGKALTLTPKVEASGNLSWACASPDLKQKYLPSSCKGT